VIATHAATQILFHSHAPKFKGTALVTLKGVEIADAGFGLDPAQEHLAAIALWAGHRG